MTPECELTGSAGITNPRTVHKYNECLFQPCDIEVMHLYHQEERIMLKSLSRFVESLRHSMNPVRTRRTREVASRIRGGNYTESLESRQMLSAVVPNGVNGKSSDRTPTITWSADAGAVRYEIWVSQLGENEGAVLVKAGIVSTSYTVAPADLVFRSGR